MRADRIADTIAITIRRMEIALAILLTSTLTTNGLLALWAATSQRHWFLRAAIASIGAGLALAATAVEVAITLAAQSCVVAAGFAYAARGRRQHRDDNVTAWRFSLATFLLATVLITVGAAVWKTFSSAYSISVSRPAESSRDVVALFAATARESQCNRQRKKRR